VRLAQRFAMENDLIKADAIEATEFPEAATRYRVYAVPKTVINEVDFIEGAMPEEPFLERVLSALKPDLGEGAAST
jgi:hypothetical protein